MLTEMIIILVTLFLIYDVWIFGYWKRKGVPFVPGRSVFGNVLDVLTSVKSISEMFNDIYMQTNDGLIGFYYFYNPALLVKDLQLINNVLIKDFNSFDLKGYHIPSENDPLLSFVNQVSTTSLWKRLREVHRPMHTSLKLKLHLLSMCRAANILSAYLDRNMSGPLHVREVCSWFMIDIVALCTFSTEPSCFTNPDNGYRRHSGVNLFNSSIIADYSNIFAYFPPFSSIFKIIPFRVFGKDTTTFFLYLVKTALEFRKSKNIIGNDYFGHLMKISAKRKAENLPEFSDIEYASHCMTVYQEGTETSAAVLCFALLELANNPEAQEKLREEITSSGEKPEDFSFDRIHSLRYLDMTVKEVLRIHTPVPFLSRTCVGSVKFGDITIEPGTKVFIPTSALHMDPSLFPKPTEFRPERFSKENISSVVSGAFRPFGDGPRICLGIKFAQTQVKLGLITILLKCKVVTCSGKKEPITYEKTPFVILPRTDIQLVFEKL